MVPEAILATVAIMEIAGGVDCGARLADNQALMNVVSHATHDPQDGLIRAPPARKEPLLPRMMSGSLELFIAEVQSSPSAERQVARHGWAAPTRSLVPLSEGQREKTRGKRTSGCEGQEGRPAGDAGGPAQQTRERRRAGNRMNCAASSLQRAPRRWLCGVASHAQGSAGWEALVAASLACRVTRQRQAWSRPQLGAAPEGKAVGDGVEVMQERRNERRLVRAGQFAIQSRAWATGRVVAKSIQAAPRQQQHSEESWVELHLVGKGRENFGSEGIGLGFKHRLRRDVQPLCQRTRECRVEDEGSSALPAPSETMPRKNMKNNFYGAGVLLGRGVGEPIPRRGLETAVSMCTISVKASDGAASAGPCSILQLSWRPTTPVRRRFARRQSVRQHLYAAKENIGGYPCSCSLQRRAARAQHARCGARGHVIP